MRPSSAKPRKIPAGSRAGERGFTLMEIALAFVLLAIVLSLLAGVQSDAMTRATRALDKRDVSVAANETVLGLNAPLTPDGNAPMVRFAVFSDVSPGFALGAKATFWPPRSRVRKADNSH